MKLEHELRLKQTGIGLTLILLTLAITQTILLEPELTGHAIYEECENCTNITGMSITYLGSELDTTAKVYVDGNFIGEYDVVDSNFTIDHFSGNQINFTIGNDTELIDVSCNSTITEGEIINEFQIGALNSGIEEICEMIDTGCPDDDNDGVCNVVDRCANTNLSDVPTGGLLPNHYSDVDGDGIYEINLGSKTNPDIVDSNVTINDTFGCGCGQILVCKDKKVTRNKDGCDKSTDPLTKGTMDIWVEQKAWAVNCTIPVGCHDNDNDGYWVNGPGCVEGQDCMDNNPSVNPEGVDDNCNGLDDDCNGLIDDGYIATDTNCGQGECVSSGQLECIDGNEIDSCVSGTPNDETCNGLDDNCDGEIDEGCECVNDQQRLCGVDIGECEKGLETCIDGNWSGVCEEGRIPSARYCNGKDNDCDGLIDDTQEDAVGCLVYYKDQDEDGYGIDLSKCFCRIIDDFSALTSGDCDDRNENVNPSVTEICDGLDNNCDDVVDENVCVIDNDEDGYNDTVDCDDNNASIHPGADDSLCNGIDDDCDGIVDDDYVDVPITCGQGECSDTGHFICLNGNVENTCIVGDATDEVCDGLDNNCDGEIDNDVTDCSGHCVSGECLECITNDDCEDSVGCTTDICVAGSCQNNPDDSLCLTDTSCADYFCDIADGCQAVYATTETICSDSLYCNGLEMCDGLGSCGFAAAVDCADELTCTADSCDEENDLCLNVPIDLDFDGYNICESEEKDCNDTNSSINTNMTEICGNAFDENCDGIIANCKGGGGGGGNKKKENETEEKKEFLILPLIPLSDELDVTIINKPTKIEVGEDITITAVIKNTGDTILTDVKVRVITNNFESKTVEISRLNYGAQQTVVIPLESGACSFNSGSNNIPEEMEIIVLAKSGDAEAEDSITVDVKNPDDFMVLYDKSGNHIKVCFLVNNLGRPAIEKAEIEVGVYEDKSALVLDYLTKINVPSDEIFIKAKEYYLNYIPETKDYLIKAEFYTGGATFIGNDLIGQDEEIIRLQKKR